MLFSALPKAQGLYDPARESDSCGVAMVADIQGRRSHAIVADGLTALEHLEHRGAAGAEPNSGDGAGILLQLPVELLRDVVDFELPDPGPDGSNAFAAGICFLPADPAVVDDDTKAVRTAVLFGQSPGHRQHPAEHRLVFGSNGLQRVDVTLGHDQQVHRPRRIDVVKREDFVVFVDLARRNVSTRNLAKQAVVHADSS